MRALLHMLVLLLAITPLVAPASAPCGMQPASGHACCASQIQLQAPSCCKAGTATPLIADERTNDLGNVATATGSSLSMLPLAPVVLSMPAADRSHAVPLLRPATILRT